MFANLVSPDKWVKTSALRLHTHDILCSAVTVLKNNRTALCNVMPVKQVSRLLQAAQQPAATPAVDTAPPAKKQKVETPSQQGQEGQTPSQTPSSSQTPSQQTQQTQQTQQGQAAEEGLEYPALRPLGRERCNMIAVVSGAVDGSLAVASTLSRDEHSAMKCFDYPGFFTPAAACCEGYCVLKVRAVVACECSTTTS